MADDTTDQELRNCLQILQSMIDVSAERLEGLRTQCATSAELTQQEIRTLEVRNTCQTAAFVFKRQTTPDYFFQTTFACCLQGKLIKMFSEQLVTNSRLRSGPEKHVPSLTQWLQVVGLSSASIQGLCQRIASVEELQEKSEHELRMILNERGARPEELNRLCRALHNLKRYTGEFCVIVIGFCLNKVCFARGASSR